MSTRQPAVPSRFLSDIPYAPAPAAFTPPTIPAYPLGGLLFFAGPSTPLDPGEDPFGVPHWLGCVGQEVLISLYPDLAALLGSTWGVASDPATLFKLPNLQGRFPLASSATFPAATAGGEVNHTLTLAETPALGIQSVTQAGEPTYGLPVAAAFAGRPIVSYVNTGAQIGGGGAHNNMPPYLALSTYIKAIP